MDLFVMAMGLLGGLALFLYGMEQMAEGLKSLAGNRLKAILARLTTNRLSGACTGAFVTALLQSSSVTTVLTVGFISAGILSLSQAVGIIFGANVGTTITAQIIAFKVTHYALLLVAAGFALLFVAPSDHGNRRQCGLLVMGLGLIFFGMNLMGMAMEPLRSHPGFLGAMARIENPLFGIALAAAFTGLVQSSSATTGVVIAMASQGLITLPAGITLIFGANIGTCVTAALASIGKPRPAVRASLVHILFNVLGVAVWLSFVDRLGALVIWMSPAAATLTGAAKLAAETPRQIANAHTVFNVVNTLLFLPLGGLFVRLVERLVPVEEESAGPAALTEVELDPALLEVPAIALQQAQKATQRMAAVVRSMLGDIMPAFTRNEAGIADAILRLDAEVDELQERITDYLVRISRRNISPAQATQNLALLDLTGDLEHIGDLIEKSLIPLVRKKARTDARFSAEGWEELAGYHQRVLDSYDIAVEAVGEGSVLKAQSVLRAKAELAELARQYRTTHYRRLSDALPESMESSQIHLDLVDGLRRVESYIESIALAVLDSQTASTTTPDETG